MAMLNGDTETEEAETHRSSRMSLQSNESEAQNSLRDPLVRSISKVINAKIKEKPVFGSHCHGNTSFLVHVTDWSIQSASSEHDKNYLKESRFKESVSQKVTRWLRIILMIEYEDCPETVCQLIGRPAHPAVSWSNSTSCSQLSQQASDTS